MTTAIESSPAGLRWRLREATRIHHSKVEQYVAIHETCPTRVQYVSLLETLWGFYNPLEAALSRLDWPHNVDFAARRKASWLFDDLIDLGRTPREIQKLPQCSLMPAFDSAVSGLGVLYVLEGATLGGQLIVRQIGPALGLRGSSGLSFFSSYGVAVSEMWRNYIAVLEQAGHCPNACAEIERTALDTFVALQAWFERVRQMERTFCQQQGSNAESVS